MFLDSYKIIKEHSTSLSGGRHTITFLTDGDPTSPRTLEVTGSWLLLEVGQSSLQRSSLYLVR